MMKTLPGNTHRKGSGILRWSMMLVLGLLVSGRLSAAEGDEIVSVKFINATVQEVFTFLDNKTTYDFVYNDAQLAGLPKVSIQKANATVKEVVSFCLRGSKLSYQVRGKTIIIKPMSEMKTDEVIRLSGKVIDEHNIPIAGVAIIAVGTGRGSVTSPNGEFVFVVKKSDEVTLNFSFLGMKPYTMALYKGGKLMIKDPKQINVRMESSTSQIDDIVVTGIVNLSRKSFTGSTTTISGAELKTVSPTNILSAVQIFDPSFRLSENLDMGSNPNHIPDMYVRGRSGIGTTELDAESISERSLKNNPNLPIYMLDGYEVPVSKIYDLDVERVESYTILKDAAATAMYGSRAANGVIVITTIPPVAGKLNVNYSTTVSVSAPDLTSYNLMNATEKLETERLAGLYQSADPARLATLQKEYNLKAQNIEMGISTDWLALPLRTSVSHKHSLYLDGGSEDFKYGLELRYDRQNGVMKDLNREKMGLGMSLQYTYKGFTFRNQISGDFVNSHESSYGSFSDFVRMNPYDTYFDENGKIAVNLKTWHGGSAYRNPMYDATLGSFDKSQYKEFYDNFDIKWYINSKINFKANIALNYKTEKTDKFVDPASSRYMGNPTRGSLNKSTRVSSGYDLNVNGYYSDRIGKHNLNLVVGVNIKQDDVEGTNLNFVGFPEGGFSAPGYAQELKYSNSNGFTRERSRLFGSLAVFNYTFNDIILFDLSGRIDGSSQFGSKKRFAPFFATGIGANLHNLGYLKKNAPWLTQFKVRATYGMTGKVNFPSYAGQHKYQMTDKGYGTGEAVEIMYMGNPSLQWEKTLMTDFGTEITIKDGLLYAKYTYYQKDTKDLIADMFIPASSGFTMYKENVGRVENRGHEIMLRSRIVKTKNTQIYLSLNGTHNRGKLKEISNALRSYNERVNESQDKESGTLSPLLRYTEGGSLTALYGMQSLGIDPATGKEQFLDKNGNATFNWRAGDNVVIGDTEPTMSGTFGLSAAWKGFSIDAYFMYEWGSQRYNTTLLNTVEMADIRDSNCDRRVLTDRWKNPGDVAKYRDIKEFQKPTKATSRFVQDYNMFNLSAFSFGYEFDRGVISRIGLRRLKLQFNMRDVFTVSSIQIERGLSTPFARTFNLSINASF